MDFYINFDDLANLTLEYGGQWGLQHSNRLLALVEKLGTGREYDRDIVRLTAYLHDWGGYTPWAKPGVEHHLRSCEVALPWLQAQGTPEPIREHVLECIRCHHGGPLERTMESRLFTDADALDLLGVVGVCRIFAMCPRDIRLGFERVQYYRDTCMAAISLPETAPLAAERLKETEELLARFTEETLGIF
jgi:HD superfamily phosphodiesterase